MTDFITRVSLLSGQTNPETLDRAMGAYNFVRQYTSVRGITYDLPEGTFFSQSDNMAAADVRNMAAAAIRNIGSRYDIVTVCGEIACFLHPAR